MALAVESGVNFIDILQTDPAGDGAYVWNGLGPLVKQYRDKLVLAAHWGIGYQYDLPYCRKTFPEALAQVGNGFIDIALMTMVGESGREDEWIEESLQELRQYKEKGQIGCLGGSAHDLSTALKLVTSGVLDVLMFTVNMTQAGEPQHQALYQACLENEVGLIAMKSYSASLLLKVAGQPTTITPVQCLSYVLSQPVSTIAVGVKNGDELRAALAYCEATRSEKDYQPALDNLHQELAGHCVYCNHCLPCEEGINITSVISINNWAKWGVQDWLEGMYAALPVKPSACIGQGDCVERCAFEVDIVGKMRHVEAVFEWDLWGKRDEDELREMAHSLGIDEASDMSKAILIDSIRHLDPDLLYRDLGPV
jgi:predicted aldo/keto reductase-like oxidoreductase